MALALACIALVQGAGAQPVLPSDPVLPSLNVLGAPASWEVVTAEGVGLHLSTDAGPDGAPALRMDFDFRGGAGYAIARRAVALRLPANYRFRLTLRAQGQGGGPAPVNDLEFKLVGPSGEDVWWHNRRRFVYPEAWTPLTTRARQVEFAWGPSGGGLPDEVVAVEVVVTAHEGGAGTLWLGGLTLDALPPDEPYTGTPAASASARAAEAAHVLDGDAATAWTAPPGEHALTLDFGRPREFGGLTLDWGEARAARYDVETSDDGEAWTTRYRARDAAGARDRLPLPETEARWVRLRLLESANARGYRLGEVRVEGLAFSASPNAFFARIAADAPRGHFPRAFRGEATYWTVAGLDGAEAEALVGEDGQVEVGVGRFSIEPFLLADGRLLTWADADTTFHRMADGTPVFEVEHRFGTRRLTVTAGVVPREHRSTPARSTENGRAEDGSTPDEGTLVLGYRLDGPAPARLVLAARPFAVNPPYQFLGAPAGAVPLRRVRLTGDTLVVDDLPVLALRRPDAAGAAPFDGGDVTEWLARNALPPHAYVTDPFGHAGAALAFDLAPGEEVWLLVPMDGSAPLPGIRTPAEARAALARTVSAWQARTGGLVLSGPPDVEALGRALRAQAAYVLVNRDGPAIQPGSRAYDRSWIRDGALTASALLRLGLAEPALAFARWYAPFQYPSGRVPCCVDGRGADPTAEHDSHGQLIFLVAEAHRYTGDDAFLRELYPHVRAAARAIEALSDERRTPTFAADSLRHLYGLMPASISHEGYSARPAYSYWDDLFALRGLKDAVYAALALGEREDAAHFARVRDRFAGDLGASVRRSMTLHGIDYIPGAADLGDFDATSTTVALDPAHAADALPDEALRATFERYWAFFEARRDGREPWEAYTPYEWRTVGALVRLGWPERAHEALSFFMSHRRPRGWDAWAEVVWQDERLPRFIGDTPHTWVGSDFVRSALDLFAYAEGDGPEARLVVGAGLPLRWAEHPGGVGVRGLHTHGGPLAFALAREGDALAYTFSARPALPPGGVEVRAPFGSAPVRATADGRAVPLRSGAVTLGELPARLLFHF